MKTAISLVAMVGLVGLATPAKAAPADDAVPIVAAPTTAALTTATPTTAAPAAAPTTAAVVAAAPLLVARWDFNAGLVAGKIADTSGRGPALTPRVVDSGVIRFDAHYAAFPAACAAGATSCPRGLLEAANAANLNPGVRNFRWSARILVTKAQLQGSPNVMQKGVAGTGSQWKMQLGRTQGRAQCVVAGTGAATTYLVRSTNTVADGAWHQVTCQRFGTSLTVSVDGTVRGTTTVPATLSIGNALPLRLGGPNFNIHSDMYHGYLDDAYAELG